MPLLRRDLHPAVHVPCNIHGAIAVHRDKGLRASDLEPVEVDEGSGGVHHDALLPGLGLDLGLSLRLRVGVRLLGEGEGLDLELQHYRVDVQPLAAPVPGHLALQVCRERQRGVGVQLEIELALPAHIGVRVVELDDPHGLPVLAGEVPGHTPLGGLGVGLHVAALHVLLLLFRLDLKPAPRRLDLRLGDLPGLVPPLLAEFLVLVLQEDLLSLRLHHLELLLQQVRPLSLLVVLLVLVVVDALTRRAPLPLLPIPVPEMGVGVPDEVEELLVVDVPVAVLVRGLDEAEHVLRLEVPDPEELQGSPDLRRGQVAGLPRVEHAEGVVGQQGALAEALPHPDGLRPALEHVELGGDAEEHRQRGRLPPVRRAAAAAEDGHEEHDALPHRRGLERADQRVELGRLEVHVAVEVPERLPRGLPLVGRGPRELARGVEDHVPRLRAPQGQLGVRAVDQPLLQADVHDPADRLGLGQGHGHGVPAPLLLAHQAALEGRQQPPARQARRLPAVAELPHHPRELRRRQPPVGGRADELRDRLRPHRPRVVRVEHAEGGAEGLPPARGEALRAPARRERLRVGRARDPLERHHHVLDAAVPAPGAVEVVVGDQHVRREGDRLALVELERARLVELRARAAVAQAGELPRHRRLVVALVRDVHVLLDLDLLLLLLFLFLLLLLLLFLLLLLLLLGLERDERQVEHAVGLGHRLDDPLDERLVVPAHHELLPLLDHAPDRLREHPRLGHRRLHAEVQRLAEHVEALAEVHVRLAGVDAERLVGPGEGREPALAPDVAHVLHLQHVELDALHAHRVDDEPGRGVVEHLLPRRGLGDDHAGLAQLPPHVPVDLRDDEQVDALALADPAHAVGGLGVVPPRHVLPDRQHRGGVELVLDVHPGGVHLVIEREPARLRDAALGELEHAAGGADEDHLPVLLVEEDDAVTPREAAVEEVPRHVVVGHAGDQGADVDEGGPGPPCDAVEQQLRVPALGDQLVAADGGRGELVEHLAVGADLVVARPELDGHEVGGRPGEPDPPREEHGAPQLLPAGAELHALVPHVLLEDVVA
mmetsp:Transcript_32702/g.79522  ORF Transcript_32702/g.79522 Transcript_32702/m.79522 type:complete len:1055 (-) Transcript_32702:2641-5805(-)